MKQVPQHLILFFIAVIVLLQVAPVTIHPTIDKAAHYFNLEVIHVPVTSDFRADVSAMSKVIQFHFILN